MKRHEFLRKAVSLGVVLAAVFPACRAPAPRLLPPAEISSLEGYASLRLSTEAGSGKAKISFLVRPPSQGRVEVFDVLGRVVFYFVLDGPAAQIVVPSEKIFALAASEEVMARFLGFALSLEEWTAVLAGFWPDASSDAEGPSGWSLERDGRKRVVSGRKGEVFFEVTEFFSGSPAPRRIAFGSQLGEGRLTVLSLRYNSNLRDAAFLMTPPGGYQSRTWEDVERLLRRED